ncbi:MAG: hypothetical protein HS110_02285 [Zoogloeaceae bacterium]|nr:hypothetical protein [Zoogloeaceae bacterium]MCK6385835.1 hypothetical protein [Rhodocyclaceae bacterium]
MRPLFTIHAGELLVGEHIERHFRNLNVWVPSKDSGIDLLVTDKKNKRSISLQVKYSRDFLVTHLPAEFQRPLRACGWWTFNPTKLSASSADYWVLLLLGFAHRTTDYVIIPPKELFRRLRKLHPEETGKARLQTYLWTTMSNRCWETRNLKRPDHHKIAEGNFQSEIRDFSPFLNNWEAVKELNGK